MRLFKKCFEIRNIGRDNQKSFEKLPVNLQRHFTDENVLKVYNELKDIIVEISKSLPIPVTKDGKDLLSKVEEIFIDFCLCDDAEEEANAILVYSFSELYCDVKDAFQFYIDEADLCDECLRNLLLNVQLMFNYFKPSAFDPEWNKEDDGFLNAKFENYISDKATDQSDVYDTDRDFLMGKM